MVCLKMIYYPPKLSNEVTTKIDTDIHSNAMCLKFHQESLRFVNRTITNSKPRPKHEKEVV